MVKFEIKIEEEQISYPQINQCITQFNIIKNRLPGKVKFEIIAEKQIKEINTLLIACFILFKQQCKDLEIVLHFKKKLANDVAFKLIQFMVHAHYTTGRIDVFTFFDSFGNEHTPRKHKDNLDYGFVLSEKFLPIIYIDKNNYNLLFEKKITHQSLDEMEKGERETGEKGEKLYQYCREFLFKKKDKFSYLEILSQLSFYGALHKAKILQMFLFDEIPDSLKQELKIIDKSKIKVSQLNFKQGEEFYSKIKHIFNALKNKPPIYHLIFYTLLSSDLLPGKLIDGNKKKAPKPPHIGMISDFKKKLTNLWKFTDKLVYGLKELAKNIIDHSSNKHGIFTGKIVTDTNSGKTENLGDQKDVKCQSYFTLNILDDSEKGVIETFLESTKKLEETFGDNKLFLKEDRKQIENGHFKFHNFFHSNESVFLNQQAKRATAHLGLLIFSKLIQTNEGILKASTWGFQQKTPRDMVPKTTSKEIELHKDILMGTNYEIRLPIDIDKEYFPDLKRRMDIPGGQSEIGKLSIENLLNFQEIDLSKKPLASIQEEADGHIITSIIKKFDLIGGESEETLWNRFNDNSLKNCKELIMEKNTFICVNFENIVEQINESQLFRFIGRWELNYPGGYLILFNIKTDLLFRLLEVNKLYLGHNVSLPYWNMDTATLVYSYEETLNGKLYLADALGGETRSDYLYINKLIANNNYNALSLSPFDNWEKEKINASKGDVYLNRINLFFEATTLFPFDLLIKDKTGLTLFEHNSTTLLKNELKQIR